MLQFGSVLARTPVAETLPSAFGQLLDQMDFQTGAGPGQFFLGSLASHIYHSLTTHKATYKLDTSDVEA